VENPSKYLGKWYRRFLDSGATYPPRAPRFRNKSPVRYRRVGETVWSQGGTLNCSLSGVLFRSEQEIDIDTPIEMTFALPLEVAANQRAVVFCRGKIVRAVMPAVNDGKLRLAAWILEYLPTNEWKPELRQSTLSERRRSFIGRNQEFDPAKILPALFPSVSLDLPIPIPFLRPCPTV
jgi:hypothetical protein